jgi:hypothetical protein
MNLARDPVVFPYGRLAWISEGVSLSGQPAQQDAETGTMEGQARDRCHLARPGVSSPSLPQGDLSLPFMASLTSVF